MAFTSGSDHGFGTEYYYVDRGNLYFVFQSQGSWRLTRMALKERPSIPPWSDGLLREEKVIRHLLKEASSRNPEAVAGLLKKAETRTFPTQRPKQSSSAMRSASSWWIPRRNWRIFSTRNNERGEGCLLLLRHLDFLTMLRVRKSTPSFKPMIFW
jgi:hypothetical protein